MLCAGRNSCTEAVAPMIESVMRIGPGIKIMGDIALLIILATVIVAGGYLLSYRSGKHKTLRDSREDKTSSKE